MSGPRRLWLAATALYAVCWFWYTPTGGPLTADEIDGFARALEDRGAPAGQVERMRAFMAADDGRQLIMVNLLDMNDRPAQLPATGPGADAQALLDHYMAHMFPALLARASHPVFDGGARFDALDIAGIEGAGHWERAALVRYRSRRDLMAIATHPEFDDRHEYKLAALTKTIAFPVAPAFYLADPRLLLALVLVALAALGHVTMLGRRGTPR